jgi:phenylacetate-coenzyme A ligase PaaK-like adenylate-forming protein
MIQSLIDRIFAIQTVDQFNELALEVFRFQKEHVAVYRRYLELIHQPNPKHFSEIPHLPISFFKSHDVLVDGAMVQQVFRSSGTTGQRSKHLVADISLYERSFLPTYERFVGACSEQIILALLPNYVEQGESSLVYMVEKLIAQTKDPLSGFYLNDFEALFRAIQQAKAKGKKVVLFGVSYALLDFAEMNPDLTQVTVIETGGMKGRRKELSKEELHRELIQGFSCDYIASEYGMCELLSQGYSDKDGLFDLPPWMRVQLRDVYDPFSKAMEGKSGGVNVIDLANIYSCAFIETQDMGRLYPQENNPDRQLLQLVGRIDRADIRGCNLLVS